MSPATKKRKKSPKRFRDVLPLVPLKNMVVFPRMVVPLMLGRLRSLIALEEAMNEERPLFLCMQRDADVEEPDREGLHDMGVVAKVLQALRMPDNTMKVVVEAVFRAKLEDIYPGEGLDYQVASVSYLNPEDALPGDDNDQSIMRSVRRQFDEYARISQRISPDIASSMHGIVMPGDLADMIAAHLPLPPEERQMLLETETETQRLELLLKFLMRECEMQDMERQVRDRVRDQMERSHREHYLHEQLKVIQQELGQSDEYSDYGLLHEMITKASLPKEIHEKAMRELGRYERMPPMSPEGAIIRGYLEWLTELPWRKRTKDSIDLERAREVLDADHHGLKKVKDRIIEFLAVRKLSKSKRSPILCLAGPPGVGKTSLGQSIARAMKRKFVRVSLGGVRDEAEIRGHRRTYIGSMPGRIIQNMKRVGVKNPVFMLDEIDKMNSDFRGDPAAALLEVLDPAQNTAFSDHYLEVDFDLHEVFFITTANDEYDIPPALHDRLEIVHIPGYSPIEKEQIALQFLIPRQLKEAGLDNCHVEFTSDGLHTVIRRYTREAGVRELDRRIAQICRKVAQRVVSGVNGDGPLVADAGAVVELLGPQSYPDLQTDPAPRPGVAIGLAWTPAGGEILHIETSIMMGSGQLQTTGQLGDVMKESAQASYTYLRAHAHALDIPVDFNTNHDFHVHVPEGATPKDGPSAGVAIAVSMLSALRQEAPAAGLAMTGEITLRGRVLEVGGVKEKVLAAHRARCATVVLPKDNEKDMAEIPEEVKEELNLVFVEEVDEVFRIAFPVLDEQKTEPRP